MIKSIIILSFLLFISGCTSLPKNLETFSIQYGTMQIIEKSNTINGSDIIGATSKVRNMLEGDEEVSVSKLASGFRERVDISSLQQSDQLLVNSLITSIQSIIDQRFDSDESFRYREQKISILQLLDEIDEAVYSYGENEDNDSQETSEST